MTKGKRESDEKESDEKENASEPSLRFSPSLTNNNADSVFFHNPLNS